ncbi:g5991 [Coccomyxa elongata]
MDSAAVTRNGAGRSAQAAMAQRRSKELARTLVATILEKNYHGGPKQEPTMPIATSTLPAADTSTPSPLTTQLAASSTSAVPSTTTFVPAPQHLSQHHNICPSTTDAPPTTTAQVPLFTTPMPSSSAPPFLPPFQQQRL